MSTRHSKECVMLAAGLSSRMGKWKLMMPWGDGTILDSALASALSFCDRVVLVAGHRGNELALYYQDHPRIDVIQNPHYEAGMFSSVQCGVAALNSSRFFLALGDMPEVTPDVYRSLWFGGCRDVCLIPGHDRGKGHPILLPQRAVDLIANAEQDTTLKDVISQIETQVVSVGEQGIHWDVDTPAQYLQVAQWSGRACTMTSK